MCWKIFEQQICVSSRNVCYIMAYYDLAWRNSEVEIWDIRDELMDDTWAELYLHNPSKHMEVVVNTPFPHKT